MDRPDAIAADDRPTLLLSANAGWNIAHFRGALVRRLAADGWRLVVAVPASGADALAGLPVETVPIELDRSGVNPLAERRVLAAYRAFAPHQPTLHSDRHVAIGSSCSSRTDTEYSGSCNA